MQPQIPSECLFHIPRKPVAGERASAIPSPKGNRGVEQILGHLERMSGLGKMTKRVPSLACLDAENAALGFHAYPSASSTTSKCDRVLPPPTLKPSSNDKAPIVDHKHRRLCSRDDCVNPPGTRPGSTIPNLGKAYRRPKVLLPAHFQEASAPPHDVPPRVANTMQTTTGATHHSSGCSITEQRPHMKRTPATTAIQKIDAKDDRGPHLTSQERAAIGHDKLMVDMGLKRHQISYQSSGSTCATRPAFLDVPRHKRAKTHNEIRGNRQPEVTFGQTPPLLRLNGVLLADQENIVSDPSQETHLGTQDVAHGRSSPTAAGNDPLHRSNSHGANERCNAAKTTGTNPISVQNMALEIMSLIDFEQVHGQFLKTVRHGLLAMGRTPWAIRTLRSSDATATDCLSAARCILVASFYLIGLLSVFAAGMRTLELVVGIGKFCWYPMSVLLSLARWILNP
ncbi:MAG: hypothetical protein Q9224_000099 [Gallowayella concinna]